MELSEYIEFVEASTHSGVKDADRKYYYSLGFDGEIGEICQLCSKALRTVGLMDFLPDKLWEKMIDECGDVLYYYVGAKLLFFPFQEGWNDTDTPIVIMRDDSIATIAGKVQRAGKGCVPIRVERLTLAELADRNYQKLNDRKAEIGTFAK
jgi:hypothetical protein